MLAWLIDQKAWKVVDKLTERFAPRFAAEPVLLYSLAQACAERGEKQRAEETALRAFHLHPGKQEEQLVHHYAVAQQLRDRGQFAWARREYEHVIGQGSEEEELTVMSRIYLSEMLHEQGQDLDAAGALDKLVRAIDAGKVTEAMLFGREIRDVRSRLPYFYACHWETKNDAVKQQKYLDKALEVNPEDIDALIACYHLPHQPAAYHKKIVGLVEKAAAKLHQAIAVDPDSPSMYNQYAWLVGNTEGDFDEAVQLLAEVAGVAARGGRLLRHARPRLFRQGRLRKRRQVPNQGRAARSPFRTHPEEARRLPQKARGEKEEVKSLSVCGTELRCIDRGQGRPVLFVHGFPLDHTMWAAQIEAISQQCRVIAPDLRGFGRSAGGKGDRPNLPERPEGCCTQIGPVPFSMEQFADDLAALLDALGIREPVVYCGLSMGGYIAFQFWRKYAARLRGLVLCDTRSAADTPEAAAARRVMADRVLKEGPAPLVETMLPRLFCETTRQQRPEVVEGLRRVMMANSPRGIAAAALGMAERPDMTASLTEIRCPTLVVVGQDDVISPPAEMRGIAEAIPGARFVEIPAAGHMSPLENPAAVNAAIVEFLATL